MPRNRQRPTRSSRGRTRFLAAVSSSLDERLLPVEGNPRGGRLVRRTDEPAVARRDAHHVAEPAFAAVDVGECLLDLGAEEEILFPSLGLLVALAPPGPLDHQGMDLPPGLEGTVAARLAGLEVPVGEIQFPVRLLGVAHQVANAGLEVGQGDVGVDPGEEHAPKDGSAEVVLEGVRSGDPVVRHARTLEERLVEGEVVVGLPGRGDSVLADRGIVVVVQRLVGETERGTRRGPFGEAGGPVARVAEKLLLEDERADAADVLRSILPVPGQ